MSGSEWAGVHYNDAPIVLRNADGTVRVEWKDGRVVAQPDDRGGGHRIPSSNLMESALPLVEVLRKLPPTTEVEEAYSESRPMGEGNAAIPVVWIEGPDRFRVATLDARTGAAIR